MTHVDTCIYFGMVHFLKHVANKTIWGHAHDLWTYFKGFFSSLDIAWRCRDETWELLSHLEETTTCLKDLSSHLVHLGYFSWLSVEEKFSPSWHMWTLLGHGMYT